jgi:cellulose synthase/poly-beta-1,6-N-acetylglucosamine synthase-like glycosyltransferase
MTPPSEIAASVAAASATPTTLVADAAATTEQPELPKPPRNDAEQAACRRRIAAEASSGGGGRFSLAALRRQWVAWVKARNGWCQTAAELWAEAFGGRGSDAPWLPLVRALGPEGVGLYTRCYFNRKHVSAKHSIYIKLHLISFLFLGCPFILFIYILLLGIFFVCEKFFRPVFVLFPALTYIIAGKRGSSFFFYFKFWLSCLYYFPGLFHFFSLSFLISEVFCPHRGLVSGTSSTEKYPIYHRLSCGLRGRR